MGSLSDRAVLITGGGSGIGRAIALRAAREGARVLVCGRTEEPLIETVTLLQKRGGEGHWVRADVTSEKDVHELAAATLRDLGRIDGLVHCAGDALRGTKLHETDEQSWNAMLAVNLGSARILARAVVPTLSRSGGGAIVHVASNLAFVGLPGLGAYIAAKGGLVSLTRAMAAELGPEKIRVNALCPGLVRTPLTEHHAEFSEQARSYAVRAPLSRIGEPEDVAGAAIFLLSDDARWITGQSLVVDGGYASV